MSIPVTANAYSPYCTQSETYVVNHSSENPEDIQSTLMEYGIDINSLNFGNCSIADIKQEIMIIPSSQCTDTEIKEEIITPPSSQYTGTDSQTNPDGQTEAPEDTTVTKPETPGTADNLGSSTITDPNTDVTPNTDPGIQSNAEQLTYAQQVVKLVNEERAKVGLPPLSIDPNVEAAANVRAEETVIRFSHTRPNGTSFSTALKEQNVSYRMSGENIAYGQKSPEEVMEAWMNSPGHRANILSEKFTTIGVGYYQSANGTNYWSQLFTS